MFPHLGITVEILRTSGRTVQVGVEAPRDVQILRGELSANSGASLDSSTAHSKAQHEMRNRLNKANLAIKLLQKQIAAGRIVDAETSLAVALEAFGEMEQMVTTPAPFKSGPGLAMASTSPGPKRKRALLVEDDPNERVLLAAYLRSSGFEVDTAEDGQAALDYLAHQKPDAIVMDMEMPRLHGAECVKEIRSDHQFDDMKLFVVSGIEQRASNVPSGDRGVQRWFQKPLSPEDLVHALESSLN
jgi:CheY-like chemotaxis protein/sRNA-binding carbon storage regulator CsrA